MEITVPLRTHPAKAVMFRETAKSTQRKRGPGVLPLALALALALTGLALGGSTAFCAVTGGIATGPAGSDAQSFDHLAAQAEAAMNANQIPRAIRLYEQATALQPAWSEGWWYLGTMSFDANQLNKARNAFLHFVSVEHRDPGPGYGMLGLTEFRLKDYHDALAALERGRELGLGTNPEFVHRVLYVDGTLFNLSREPEIALIRLTLVANQIAAAHPKMPEDAVLADTDLLDAFGLAALRIHKLPTEIPQDQAFLIRRAGYAQALIAMQDRVAAGKELKQLVAEYSSVHNMHYMYGVYLLKENPPAAIAQFRKELVVSPKSAAAHIQLALEYLRVADYKKGLQYAQTATALAPKNFVAHVACGELWLGLGNNNRAIHELQIAIGLAPGSPDAHFALSRALSAAGRSRQAAKQRAEFERLRALSNSANH